MLTSRARRNSGFTLLEMLAVLVIMAFAAMAVIQTGRSTAETAKVRSFLIEAEAMMRQARTSAIESHTDQDVIFDLEGRSLVSSASGLVLKVPAGVSLDGRLARVPERREHEFVIRFFPTGGSTGAMLPFHFRGQLYELRVNWLTGHADVRRV
jgi:general secretion pathway protein H